MDNKITIHLYLDNEDQTQITTFRDMYSNPFAVGDIVHLNVREMFPSQYNKLPEKMQLELIQENNQLKEMFYLKAVKLVREEKYIDFKVVGDTKLTIEYHCELIDE